MEETPADRVRALRAKAGSHDKLAAALGTSRQTVVRWEKGAAPSLPYRVRLARLADASPDDFSYGQDDGKEDVGSRIGEVEENMRGLLKLAGTILALNMYAFEKLKVLPPEYREQLEQQLAEFQRGT